MSCPWSKITDFWVAHENSKMNVSRTVLHQVVSAALNYRTEERENQFSNELSFATHARKKKRKASAESPKLISCLTWKDTVKCLLEKQAVTSNPTVSCLFRLCHSDLPLSGTTASPSEIKVPSLTYMYVHINLPYQNCFSPKLQIYFTAPQTIALAYAFISTSRIE